MKENLVLGILLGVTLFLCAFFLSTGEVERAIAAILIATYIRTEIVIRDADGVDDDGDSYNAVGFGAWDED